jgi:predicted Zn-dependent protease
VRDLIRAALTCLAVAMPAAARADLDLDLSVYRHKGLGIRLSMPEGWIPSEQTGYPSLILILTSVQSPATISLAVGALDGRESLRDFVARNGRALVAAVKVRLIHTRPIGGQNARWELAASAQRGTSTEIRQLYVARGQTVLVLTLSCPASSVNSLAADLHDLARGL